MEKMTIEEAIKRLRKLDSLVNNFYTDAIKMGIEALEKERSDADKS